MYRVNFDPPAQFSATLYSIIGGNYHVFVRAKIFSNCFSLDIATPMYEFGYG